MNRITTDDINQNYYKLLGVDPEAPAEIIRSAYRTLMSELGAHPDRGGSNERAIRINRAKEILLNPGLRAEYDLHHARAHRRSGYSPGREPDPIPRPGASRRPDKSSGRPSTPPSDPNRSARPSEARRPADHTNSVPPNRGEQEGPRTQKQSAGSERVSRGPSEHNSRRIFAGILIPLIIIVLLGLFVRDSRNRVAYMNKTHIGGQIETSTTQLTPALLKNWTYDAPHCSPPPVHLVAGKHEGSNGVFVDMEDTMAFGDLNGDGQEDAVVTLATSGGGTGVFYDLMVIFNNRGSPLQGPSVDLGDRVVVKGLLIRPGYIIVDMIDHGPDDPLCCPTQERMIRFTLRGSQLVKE